MQTSTSDLNKLLELWAMHNITNGMGSDPIFKNIADLHSTIDKATHSDAPWQSFSLQYPGPIADDSPSWQHSVYMVHCQDAHDVVHNILKNKAFNKKFNYVPYLGRHMGMVWVGKVQPAPI